MLSFACMSSSLPRQVCGRLFARTVPTATAFPGKGAGRHLYCRFRGLFDVYSRYNLHARGAAQTALYIKGSDDFVTSIAALIATGWNEPVPRWVNLPLKSTDFHGAPLAVRLTLPLAGCVEDFHLQVSAPCRAHKQETRGHIWPRAWSFYIFSSGGSLNQLRRAEFERKGIEDHS